MWEKPPSQLDIVSPCGSVPGDGCGPSACSEPNNVWGCYFPPSMLYRMMQIHEAGRQWPYNEVVIAAGDIVIDSAVGDALLGSISSINMVNPPDRVGLK